MSRKYNFKGVRKGIKMDAGSEEGNTEPGRKIGELNRGEIKAVSKLTL